MQINTGLENASLGGRMKFNLLLVSLIFSTSIIAGEAVEEIARTRTNFRSHVDSFLRIDKNDNLKVIIAKKTERRGLNGCRLHRGTISTKKCRVSKKTVTVPQLSLQGADIVYDNGQLVVTCGFVKNTWLGRKIKLNEKCAFSNVKKNGYTFTRFNVEE